MLTDDGLLELKLPCIDGKSIAEVIRLTQPTEQTTLNITTHIDNISKLIKENVKCTILLTGSVSRETHIEQFHDIDLAVLLPYDLQQLKEELAATKYKLVPQNIFDCREKIFNILKQQYTVRNNCDEHLLKLVVDNFEFDIGFTPDVDPNEAMAIIKQQDLKRGHIVYRLLTGTLCKLDMSRYKEAPEEIKQVIRVIKYWIKIKKWKKCKPLSFPLETMIMNVYFTKQDWTYRELLIAFMSMVIDSCDGKKVESTVLGTKLKAYIFCGKPTELRNEAEEFYKILKRYGIK
jgi:hypothetical protein